MTNPSPKLPNKTFRQRVTDPLRELIGRLVRGSDADVRDVNSFGHEGNRPGAVAPGGGGAGAGPGNDQPDVGVGDIVPFVTGLHPDLLDMPDTGGTNADHDTRYLNLSGLNGLQQFIDFALGTAPAHKEGRIFYDNVDMALAFYIDESAVSLQIGYEQWVRAQNNSGVDILDGKLARLDGSDGSLPTISLAIADKSTTTDQLIGMATHDIANGNIGIVTTFGVVRGIDTSSCNDGDILYLSNTVPGGFQNTIPLFPNYKMQIGLCQISDASVGKIHINIIGRLEDILDASQNANFIEDMDFTVTKDGGNIIGNLEAEGGGDLTMNFSDGFTILDCTPACTITLTPGTDTNPQTNYVYIPESTKVLTLSTSAWPSTEHIRVAKLELESAATTASGEALMNWNIDNSVASNNQIGQMHHITERIRKEPARHDSGTEGSVTIDPGPTPDDVFVAVTAGQVYQLHVHDFPAQDMETGDHIHVVNDSVAPYKRIDNLNVAILDSTGASLANSSFSFVVWGVQNKTGQKSHLMMNLPTGTYGKNRPEDAIADALNKSVYTIPAKFHGVGFLIARFTFVLDAAGNTWTLEDTQPLTGFTPNTTAGGGGGGSGVTSWLGLTDTPSSYAGEALTVSRVNAAETALELANLLYIIDDGAVQNFGLNTPSPEAVLDVLDGGSSQPQVAKFEQDDQNIQALTLMNATHSGLPSGGMKFHIDDAGKFQLKHGSSVTVDFPLTIDVNDAIGFGQPTPTSTAHTLSFATAVNILTVNTLLTNTHCVVETDEPAPLGGLFITLPLAASCPGRHYWIKNTDRNGTLSSTIMVNSGADTINGAVGAAIVPGAMVHYVSGGGTNWEAHE